VGLSRFSSGAFLAALAAELGARVVEREDGRPVQVRLPSQHGGGSVSIVPQTFGRRIHLALNRGSSLFFAIGAQPEPWDERRARLADIDPPLYLPTDAGGEADVRAWLTAERLDLLRELGLRADESIRVYHDGVACDLRRTDAQTAARRVALIAQLGETLPPAPPREAVLPRGFRALRPLLSAWSSRDDLQRAEQLAEVSSSELEGLVAAVKPHFEAINLRLQAAGEPLPEELQNLQALAEAAAEAEIELAQRAGGGA
jgi:hypothetical protein